MEPTGNKDDKLFTNRVSEKEKLKLDAKEEKGSEWFGLSMFGMVGWSVVVPTLVGAAIGIRLDKIHHQSFSWTLTLLVAGLFIGCLIAWHWVTTEEKTKEK